MMRMNVKEARQQFSHLLDQVEHGEEIVILRRGHIVAHLIPPVLIKHKKGLPSLKQFRDTVKVTGKPLSMMITEEREGR